MWLVIQSFFVYGLIIFVMYSYGVVACRKTRSDSVVIHTKTSSKSIWNKYYFVIPIFIFSLFSALRENVGMDCPAYKKAFYETLNFGQQTAVGGHEELFLLILKLSSYISNYHYAFFFVFAFIQISFLYSALKHDTRILPYFMLCLFAVGEYHSLMNGVRQEIVACAFVFLVPWILNKKWVVFIIALVVLSAIHRSALILLPLGMSLFFLQKKILKRNYQFIIIALCYVFMDKIDTSFLENIFAFGGEHAGYETSSIEGYSQLEMTTKNFGFASWLRLLVYLFAIYYSPTFKKVFNYKLFNVYYNLFFINTALFLLFYNNFTVNRLLYYTSIFVPIVLSMLLFSTKNSKTKTGYYLYNLTLCLFLISITYLFYTVIDVPGERVLYKFDF